MELREKKALLREKGISFANNANEETIDRLASENGITFADSTNNGTNANNATANNTANNGTNANNNGNGNGNDSLQKFITECGGEFFAADSTTAQDAINAARSREYPDFGRLLNDGEYNIINQVTVKQWKSPRDGRISNIWCFTLERNGEYFLCPLSVLCGPAFPFVRVENGNEIEVTMNVRVRVPRNFTTSQRNAMLLREISHPTRPTLNIRHAYGHQVKPRYNNEKIFDYIVTWAEQVIRPSPTLTPLTGVGVIFYHR